jgi:aryl-alcohol dehydrogenase-like predicted oxidoreductase
VPTSHAILNHAVDKGITFLDLADVYPVGGTLETVGRTEEIVGEWMRGRRDEFIIASKCNGAMGRQPWKQGNSRKHILDAVDASLARLNTDYIDLYQLHGTDPNTPLDETLEALNHLLVSGKVRYIGTSNENAYGLTKANTIAAYEGYARFQSIQNNFSLLNRRFLDELALVCRREKISLLPYSPIGGGMLSGKYNTDKIPAHSRFGEYLQLENPRQRAMADRFLNKGTLDSTARYIEIAKQANISPTTLAVAWSMNFDFVASTIIGARDANQLDESFAALDVTLSPETLAACDAVHRDILYPMG